MEEGRQKKERGEDSHQARRGGSTVAQLLRKALLTLSPLPSLLSSPGTFHQASLQGPGPELPTSLGR